jgi:hypothetical protein
MMAYAMGPSSRSGSLPVVLVVEAVEIRQLVRRILEREGFLVVEANPLDAREVLAEEPSIGALITNMPQRIEPLPSRVKVLYLSGWPDPELVEHHPEYSVLRKPFTREALVRDVTALFIKSPGTER